MAKQTKKKPQVEDLGEDIGLFEDFEEPTEVKETPEEELILEEEPLPEEPLEKFLEEEPPLEEMPPEPKPKVADKTSHLPDEILQMSSDIPVQLVAVIGKTTISVKDLMNYQMGQVIDLGRPPGETVDLVASGKLFARGELVDIDGKLGVRIVKLIR
jgi:flagellar motor switch protein FliN